MVLPIAFALMGKSVSDKMRDDEQDQIDREAKRSAFKEDRDWTRSERARMTAENQRQDKVRTAAETAALPVQPQTAMIGASGGEDEEGNPLAPNPTAAWKSVDGQVVRDPAQVGAAVQAANTPQATTERVARARMGAGDVVGAQALRVGGRHEQVADMQLTEVMRTTANKKFDEMLGGMSDFDTFASFISNAEGSASGIKLQAQRSADGKKVTLVRVNPDGSTQATAQTFDNTARGLETAKASFSKAIGPHDKITWMHQQAMEAQAAAQLAETSRHNKADETNKGEANALRLQIAQMRGGAGGQQQAPEATIDGTFDRKTATDVAKDMVKKEAENEAATGKPMTAPSVAKRVDDIVAAMYQTHANRFIAGAVQRELSAAKSDPATYIAAYAKAAQLLPPAELDRMGFPSPNARPAPAPGTSAAVVRTAPPGGGSVVGGQWVPQGGSAPQSAAPSAAAAGPASAVPFHEFVAQNITTPDGKRLISQRIQQELPTLKATIEADMKVMALPAVSGAVKARLKARVEKTAQEAEMMETFLAGNAGI